MVPEIFVFLAGSIALRRIKPQKLKFLQKCVSNEIFAKLEDFRRIKFFGGPEKFSVGLVILNGACIRMIYETYC